MRAEDLPALTPEEALHGMETHKDEIAGMINEPLMIPFMAAMGLILQEAVHGECKACGCTICTRIRETLQNLLDTLES